MKIHEGTHVTEPTAPLPVTVGCVDKTLREPQTVLHIVTTAAPLPAVWSSVTLSARVAGTLRQVAGATCLGHGVRDTSTRRSVDERCLFRS